MHFVDNAAYDEAKHEKLVKEKPVIEKVLSQYNKSQKEECHSIDEQTMPPKVKCNTPLFSHVVYFYSPLLSPTAHVSNLRPVGQIRPNTQLYLAREIISYRCTIFDTNGPANISADST